MLSVSEDMLAAAHCALPYLGRRKEQVAGYVLAQMAQEGAFMNRGMMPDLYYSVFGIDALLALDAVVPEERLAAYLRGQGDGSGLDYMHLTCLARCWARIAHGRIPDAVLDSIPRRIEACRTRDGGYNTVYKSRRGSVTGIYLAFAAYQDMRLQLPDAAGVLECLSRLRTPDGGYGNERGMHSGTTLATAGALILQQMLSGEHDRNAAEWLWRQTGDEGGFTGSPETPLPDLLSTATAVYAARLLQHAPDQKLLASVVFTESLQTDEGGYSGHWLDSQADLEYTFYALLVLGCLMGDSGIDSSEFMLE